MKNFSEALIATHQAGTSASFLNSITEPTEVTITKPAAEILFSLNTRNRDINKGKLERMKIAHRQGNFKNVGDSIKIAKTMVLNDGQHRLQMVIDTGLPLTVVLVTGKEASDFAFIDVPGAARTAADALKISGVEGNSAELSTMGSAAKFVLAYGQHVYSHFTATNDEVVTKVKADLPVLRKFHPVAKKISKRLGAPTSTVLALAVIGAAKSEAATKGFLDRVADNIGHSQGDAALAYHNFLQARLAEKNSGAGKKTPIEVIFWTGIKALDAHLHGRVIGRLIPVTERAYIIP